MNLQQNVIIDWHLASLHIDQKSNTKEARSEVKWTNLKSFIMNQVCIAPKFIWSVTICMTTFSGVCELYTVEFTATEVANMLSENMQKWNRSLSVSLGDLRMFSTSWCNSDFLAQSVVSLIPRQYKLFGVASAANCPNTVLCTAAAFALSSNAWNQHNIENSTRPLQDKIMPHTSVNLCSYEYNNASAICSQ